MTPREALRSPRFAATKLGRAAIAAWKRLSPREQREAVRELIDTRHDELVRAYPNVLLVTSGYGTYRARKPPKSAPQKPVAKRISARRRVDDVLGVTFVVQRKRRRMSRRDRIPSHLLAYWTVGGERVLCAIPTDVESADELRPVTQTPTAVTREGLNRYSRGVTTALVKPPEDAAGPLWALSCRHVFGMSEYVGGASPTGNRVHVEAPPKDRFARVTQFWGRFRVGEGTSFDAALAKVSSRELADRAVPVACTRFATIDEIPRDLVIHVARPEGALRISATRTHYYTRDDNFGILCEGLGVIYHAELFEMLAEPATLGGDSGSPVTGVRGYARVLMGMHIAGVGGRAYMLPAYQLLRMENFLRLSSIYGGTFLSFA